MKGRMISVTDEMLHYLYETPAIVFTDYEGVLGALDNASDVESVDVYETDTDSLEDFWDISFDKYETYYIIRLEDLEPKVNCLPWFLDDKGFDVEYFSQLIDEKMSEVGDADDEEDTEF